MASYNNQTIKGNKIRNYAKMMIGCAIITICTANPTSAMFARRGAFKALRSVASALAHPMPVKEGLSPSRSYHVEPSLDKETQYRTLVSIFVKRTSSFDLVRNLSEAESLGVEEGVLDVAMSFYVEPKKVEVTSPQTTFEGVSSHTGC